MGWMAKITIIEGIDVIVIMKWICVDINHRIKIEIEDKDG